MVVVEDDDGEEHEEDGDDDDDDEEDDDADPAFVDRKPRVIRLAPRGDVWRRRVDALAAQVSKVSFDGASAGTATLDVKVAKPDVAKGLVHKYVVMVRQNARRGTASTLTKSEVRGGGRKPFKQKGTGNARAGSNRTPLKPGGGVVFGADPSTSGVLMLEHAEGAPPPPPPEAATIAAALAEQVAARGAQLVDLGAGGAQLRAQLRAVLGPRDQGVEHRAVGGLGHGVCAGDEAVAGGRRAAPIHVAGDAVGLHEGRHVVGVLLGVGLGVSALMGPVQPRGVWSALPYTPPAARGANGGGDGRGDDRED